MDPLNAHQMPLLVRSMVNWDDKRVSIRAPPVQSHHTAGTLEER
jgi:hypothetical protein